MFAKPYLKGLIGNVGPLNSLLILHKRKVAHIGIFCLWDIRNPKLDGCMSATQGKKMKV